MFSKHTACEFSSKLISTFVLPQFDELQIISRIEIDNMFPCLRISFSVFFLYFIIDINYFDKLKKIEFESGPIYRSA